jgi:hypothetical protein
MTGEDLEIRAIQKVAEALKDLENDQRARVIDWAAKRFAVELPNASKRNISRRGDNANGEKTSSEYSDFADLFDVATPKNDSGKALVGGYWFQVVQGGTDFTGLQVNDALKNLGHGVGNITTALGNLQKQKPALVRQVEKSGRSKQARKKYKLTQAGISAVQALVNGSGSEDAE